MASTAPRLPEQFRPRGQERFPSDFTVSELASDAAGAHSPYGDIALPMPLDELDYVHPKPENLPHVLRVPGND